MNSNQPYGKQGDSSTEIGYPMCNANLNVKHKVSSVKPQSHRSGQLWSSELRMIVVKVRQTPSHEGHSSKRRTLYPSQAKWHYKLQPTLASCDIICRDRISA
jgi:hypothetical protein